MTTELTPEQKALVSRFARLVVKNGLTVPAILVLEMHRPFGYVAAQLMHMITPLVSIVFRPDEFKILAIMLERRESIEDVILAIEDEEARRSSPTRTAGDAK